MKTTGLLWQGVKGILLVCLFYSMSAVADMNTLMSKQQAESNADRITEMMHDIGDHMVVIAGDLDSGNIDLKKQKAMATHVRNMALILDEIMALILDEISQMISKGQTGEPKHHQRIGEMRKQMDEMMKTVSIGAMKPW